MQPHSEVPEEDSEWPTLEEILDFRDKWLFQWLVRCNDIWLSLLRRVRQRLLDLYSDFSSGRRHMDRRTARVLFMTYEHEGFHAEVTRPPSYPRLSLILHSRLCCTCSYNVLVPAHSRPHCLLVLHSICCLATGTRNTQVFTSHLLGFLSSLDRNPQFWGTTIWNQTTAPFL